MIVKVAEQGKSMPGLIRYLYGPGKADDHRDQHMVAGYGALPFVYAGPLSPTQAGELGRVVEWSWREQFREESALAGHAGRGVSAAALSSSGGGSQVSLNAPGLPQRGNDPDANFKEHVYHVVASLGPEEGTYTDEQWSQVATGIVEGIGFSTGPQDMNANSWVAVRHGLSAQGNDHIHIAINQVRQDGHRTRLHQDKNLSQVVRRELEQRLDFVTPLSHLGHDRGRGQGVSLPAYTNKEAGEARDRTTKGHPVVPDRVQLQRLVRSAAGTAGTEAQFIQNLLDQDAQVEAARWAPGGHDQVTGYRVRLDDDARWFTASQLAPDLTLGKLRPEWKANETEQTRTHALGLWREEIAPAETPETDRAAVNGHLVAATNELAAWTDQLRAADPFDADQWRRETAAAAHVASALSPRLPLPLDQSDDTQPVPSSVILGQGADTLTRISLNPPPPVRFAPHDHAATAPVTDTAARVPPTVATGPSHAELAARHVILALRASSPDSHRGWLAVLQQFGRTISAIRDAHELRGEVAASRLILTGALSALDQAHERLQQLKTAVGVDESASVYDTVHETAFEDLSPAAQRVRASQLHGTPGGRLRLEPTAGDTTKPIYERPRPTREPGQDRGTDRGR